MLKYLLNTPGITKLSYIYIYIYIQYEIFQQRIILIMYTMDSEAKKCASWFKPISTAVF